MALSGLVRYEPAALSVSRYAWVTKYGSKFEYLHEPLPDLDFLNAYVFPPVHAVEFLQSLPAHKVALVFYPRGGIHHSGGFSFPTPVQRRRIALRFAKADWNRIEQSEETAVFWKHLGDDADVEAMVKLLEDSQVLPLVVLSQHAVIDSNMPFILSNIGIAEPPHLGSYYPTASAIRFLKQERLGLLFATFDVTYDHQEVFVYLPWRL